MNKKLTIFLVVVLVAMSFASYKQQQNLNVVGDRVLGIEDTWQKYLEGSDMVGGITRTKIGIQTAWLTDLIPSASYTVDLGSTTLPVQDIFSKNASLSTNFEVSGRASISQLTLQTPLADAYIIDTLTASNYVRKSTWTDIDNYPTGCTNQFVTTIGDTLTCATVSNSYLTAGTELTLTASTSNWNSFYHTPSTRITDGTGLTWSGNTLNVDDIYVLTAGDTMTGNLIGTGASFSTGFDMTGATSSSFGGSLDVTKGIHGLAGITATGTIKGSNLSGTNTGDITLDGTPNYLTLANQVLTLTKLDISDDTNLTAGTDLTLTTNDIVLDSTLTQAFSFTNAGSQSFTGSLNVSKGIHALANLTATGPILGYSAASNSYAGSLSIAKGLTANSWQGGGLTSCADTTTSKLLYANGQFSCGTDQNTGGSSFTGLLMGEGSTAKTHIDSLTYSPSSFNFSPTASAGTLTLDYTNGPASRSISNTWSALNIFSAGASVSPTFEVGTDNFKVNSSPTGLFDVFNVASASGTSYFNVAYSGGVSISKDFEVIGRASASKYFGAGLTDCDTAATSKLLWSDTGGFSCGTDSTAFDATTIDAVTWSDGANASNVWTFNLSGVDPTLTFQNNGFLFTGNASVSKNFDVGGFASASYYRGGGITGAGSCDDATDKLLYDSTSGLFSCGILTVADTGLTAGTDLTLTTNDLTLDSTLTQAFSFSNAGSQSMTGSLNVSKGIHGLIDITATGKFIGYSTASNSFSGSLNALKGLTATNATFSGTGSSSFAGSLNVTKGIHALGNLSSTLQIFSYGTASNSYTGSLNVAKGIVANAYSGAGLTACSAATKVLRFNSGQFSCGTLASADITADMINDTHIDWGTGANQVSIADLTGNQISGALVWDLGGATSFELPNTAALTVDATGEIGIHTGSKSLDWFDSVNTIVQRNKICFNVYIETPKSTNPKWIGHKRFDDPFTITDIQSVASGSGSAGWDLYYGAPGANTTTVFTLAKSASISSYPTYTSFANSTILDNNVLDVVISSPSATLQSFTVSICGRYTH